MAEKTNFTLYRGTSLILRFQLTTPEPAPDYVTGWTTLFTVRYEEDDANTVISVPGALSTIPNALKYGIFDVFLSAANTNLLVTKRSMTGASGERMPALRMCWRSVKSVRLPSLDFGMDL